MIGPRIRRLLLTAVAGVLALTACSGEKDYRFADVRIDATILADGSLSLVERRTFDFDGSFSFAFFTIDWNPDLIEDFAVRDEDGEPLSVSAERDVFTGGFKGTWFFSAADERRTFTISYLVRCAVDVYADAAHLLWQFVGTGWEKPTEEVAVRVRVPGRAEAASRPAGCAPGQPEPEEPGESTPLARGDVRAWGHGPLGGEVRIPDPQTVTLAVEDLPAETFVEGSILFPAESVPFAVQRPEPKRAEILREEGKLAAEANAARRRYLRTRTVAIGATVGLPLLFALLVLLARRRDRIPGIPRYLQEPPEDLHPVELAYLWAAYKGDATPKSAYRTQLLHLARQGLIDIEPVGRVTDPEDFRLRLRKRPERKGLDREFVEFLFAAEGKSKGAVHQGPVLLKDVKVTGKRQAELRQWGRALQSKTRANATRLTKGGVRRESWIAFLAFVATTGWAFVSGAADPSTGAFTLLGGIGIVFVVTSLGWALAGGGMTIGGRIVAMMVIGGVVAGICLPVLLPLYLGLREGGGLRLGHGEILLGVASMSWLIALRFMPERIEEAARTQVQRWGAFRRFLREFSALPDAPTLAVVVWERYLVYATALGVADEVERQVRALVPPQELPAPIAGAPAGVESLHWMRAFGASSTPSSVHSAFVSASSGGGSFSSGSGSFSSGGGFGGGFSGGGGGGGGGTGGGAG